MTTPTTRNAKKIQSKSRAHVVAPTSATTYTVTSGESGKTYTVTTLPNGGAGCTCDWAKYRPAVNAGKCGCSHVVAVFDWVAKFEGAQSVSAWATEEEARKQHRATVALGDGLVLTVRK